MVKTVCDVWLGLYGVDEFWVDQFAFSSRPCSVLFFISIPDGRSVFLSSEVCFPQKYPAMSFFMFVCLWRLHFHFFHTSSSCVSAKIFLGR